MKLLNFITENLKKISQLFLAAIIVISYIIFMTDSCKKKSPTITPSVNQIQKILDSVQFSNQIKEWQFYQDTLRKSKEKNELNKKLDSTKKLLQQSRNQVDYYSGQLKIADLRNDTTSFYNYCDSLQDAAVKMNNRLGYYIVQNDSLKAVNDSLIITEQQRLEERNQIIITMRNAQYAFSLKYDSLASSVNKLNDKLNRHYSIGLGGAFGITNLGTPGVVIGVVISRDAIRFSLPKNKN